MSIAPRSYPTVIFSMRGIIWNLIWVVSTFKLDDSAWPL
jgi:hypothetical protein